MPSLINVLSCEGTPSSSTGLLPSLPGISPLSTMLIFGLITFLPLFPDKRDLPFCTLSDERDEANMPINSTATELSRITGVFRAYILFEPRSCTARLAACLPTSSNETSFKNREPIKYHPIWLSRPSSALAIICAVHVVEEYCLSTPLEFMMMVSELRKDPRAVLIFLIRLSSLYAACSRRETFLTASPSDVELISGSNISTLDESDGSGSSRYSSLPTHLAASTAFSTTDEKASLSVE